MEDKGFQILFILIFISIYDKKNKCYCTLRIKICSATGFPCFKSGVMNMGPCKTTESLPTGAPIALSAPHFYQVALMIITFMLHFCVVWTTTKSKLKLKLITVLNVQADQSFRDAVIGMKPDKEKHQMYVSFFYTIL